MKQTFASVKYSLFTERSRECHFSSDAEMSELTDLSKTFALELCSGHLKDSWTSITEDDIDVVSLDGGVVNRIFVCHNKKSNEKVLIRLYGGRADSEICSRMKNISLEGEVLVFHLLEVNGVGPKLLGVFDGGRIEEYLEGTNVLSNEDYKDDMTMKFFAEKLGKMHSTYVPVSKKPCDYINIIRTNFTKHWSALIEGVKNDMSKFTDITEKQQKFLQLTLDYDWFRLIHWFEENINRFKGRIVFSHNDMNQGNFLVAKDKSVTFIDFEFCGYNFRGCDIGMHFKHRTFPPKESPDQAKLKYPSEEERRKFVKWYLKEAKKNYDPIDESIDNENHVLLEAELYGGLYYLLNVCNVVTLPVTLLFSRSNQKEPFGVQMGSIIADLEERKDRVVSMMNRLL